MHTESGSQDQRHLHMCAKHVAVNAYTPANRAHGHMRALSFKSVCLMHACPPVLQMGKMVQSGSTTLMQGAFKAKFGGMFGGGSSAAPAANTV